MLVLLQVGTLSSISEKQLGPASTVRLGVGGAGYIPAVSLGRPTRPGLHRDGRCCCYRFEHCRPSRNSHSAMASEGG